MKFDQIVTYGCSFTHGMGLPDQVDYNDPEFSPSKYAWPAVLEKFLGVPVTNRGRAGASMKYISHQIVQEVKEHSETTLVLVMWTFWHRHAILTTPDPNVFPDTLAAWNFSSRDDTQFYHKHLFHEYDSEHSDLMRIQAVNSVYQINNVKIVNMCVPALVDQRQYSHDWFSYEPEMVFSEYHILEKTYCRHPGVRANKEFARRLSKFLIEKFS